MSASQVEGVREAARGAAEMAGLVVEDVTISSAGRRRVVRVTLDLPEDKLGGVPLDSVSQASRILSEILDSSSVLGQQPYMLEVSSPGISRPLTERRHWLRARSRLVLVRTVDAGIKGEVTGRLVAVQEDGVHLQPTDAEPIVVPWTHVVRGEVQVEFGAVGSQLEAIDADSDASQVDVDEDEFDADDIPDDEADARDDADEPGQA